MSREQDIIDVCESLIEHCEEYNHTDYGRHQYECLYCGARDTDRERRGPIVHKLDCPVLKAKDLLTLKGGE